MIAVIDYKAGNLTSVVKALRYLLGDERTAREVVVTRSPDLVRGADKVVLPGVGHFQATQLLADLGLTEATRDSIAKGAPFLGICVGLQWLFEGSTEAPGTPGIGAFAGMCEHFPAIEIKQIDGKKIAAELKSPHVGWNSLEQIRSDSRLLCGVANGSFVYFTHSWRAPVVQATAAVTYYGGAFTAAVEHDNVMGVQFHPEKSADVGLRVFRNFVEL
ncbi:MAG: imidazole glycerol phosphate synthase subunit HisH [Acidobacteriaceae bacterium]